MLKSALLATVFAVVAASAAQASVITMTTRFSSDPAQASAAAYASLVTGLEASAPTAGYGSKTLNEFSNVANASAFVNGSNSNIAYDINIGFAVLPATAGVWAMQFGVDFGNGGAVFVDGTAVAFKSTDMWSNGGFSPDQAFVFTTTLAAGSHTIRIVGLEQCCDGGMAGQFRAPGSAGFTTFATTDGLSTNVPEPASLALLGGAALALAGIRRTRRPAAECDASSDAA